MSDSIVWFFLQDGWIVLQLSSGERTCDCTCLFNCPPEAASDEEDKLEPGPQKETTGHPESAESFMCERDPVLGTLGGGVCDHLEKHLPELAEVGEAGDAQQQWVDLDEQQLPPLPDPRTRRAERHKAQWRLAKLLARKQPCSSQ